MWTLPAIQHREAIRNTILPRPSFPPAADCPCNTECPYDGIFGGDNPPDYRATIPVGANPLFFAKKFVFR
jgi:hypothetical protein